MLRKHCTAAESIIDFVHKDAELYNVSLAKKCVHAKIPEILFRGSKPKNTKGVAL